ncbi:MAG: DNA glycosylase AlkZ-like family protein [Gaiellaceae bacterium]
METRPVRARRAAAQLLCGPGGATPTEIVARLLAVQAQDLRSACLALRARGEGLTAGDVDRALTGDRALVVGWLARGTLHLTSREDYPWLLALTAPARLAASRRRLGQEGVSVDESERAVAVVERALECADVARFEGLALAGSETGSE